MSLIWWYMASGGRLFWHPESTSNLVVVLLIWTSNISFPSIDDVGIHPSCDFLSFIICVSRVWITIIITFTFINVLLNLPDTFGGAHFHMCKMMFFSANKTLFVFCWTLSMFWNVHTKITSSFLLSVYDSFACPTLNMFLSGGCNLPFYLIL